MNQSTSLFIGNSLIEELLSNFELHLTLERIYKLIIPQTVNHTCSIGLIAAELNFLTYDRIKFELHEDQECQELSPPPVDKYTCDFMDINKAKNINQSQIIRVSEHQLSADGKPLEKSKSLSRRNAIQHTKTSYQEKVAPVVAAKKEQFHPEVVQLDIKDDEEDPHTSISRRRFFIRTAIENKYKKQIKKRFETVTTEESNEHDPMIPIPRILSNKREIKPFNPLKHTNIPYQTKIKFQLLNNEQSKMINTIDQFKQTDYINNKTIDFGSEYQNAGTNPRDFRKLSKEQSQDRILEDVGQYDVVIPQILSNPFQNLKVKNGVQFNQNDTTVKGEEFQKDNRLSLQQYYKLQGLQMQGNQYILDKSSGQIIRRKKVDIMLLQQQKMSTASTADEGYKPIANNTEEQLKKDSIAKLQEQRYNSQKMIKNKKILPKVNSLQKQINQQRDKLNHSVSYADKLEVKEMITRNTQMYNYSISQLPDKDNPYRTANLNSSGGDPYSDISMLTSSKKMIEKIRRNNHTRTKSNIEINQLQYNSMYQENHMNGLYPSINLQGSIQSLAHDSLYSTQDQMKDIIPKNDHSIIKGSTQLQSIDRFDRNSRRLLNVHSSQLSLKSSSRVHTKITQEKIVNDY